MTMVLLNGLESTFLMSLSTMLFAVLCCRAFGESCITCHSPMSYSKPLSCHPHEPLVIAYYNFTTLSTEIPKRPDKGANGTVQAQHPEI